MHFGIKIKTQVMKQFPNTIMNHTNLSIAFCNYRFQKSQKDQIS